MIPVETAPSGGLGLHVVYQTCSLVTMSRVDNCFTIHLTMRKPAAEQPRSIVA
jgi:hypothetical protein